MSKGRLTVICDNKAAYDDLVSYFKNGNGNGKSTGKTAKIGGVSCSLASLTSAVTSANEKALTVVMDVDTYNLAHELHGKLMDKKDLSVFMFSTVEDE